MYFKNILRLNFSHKNDFREELCIVERCACDFIQRNYTFYWQFSSDLMVIMSFNEITVIA